MTRELRDTLNEIISDFEETRCLEMPRIGIGHAGSSGGIFVLLRDPGGKHTTSTGAEKSGYVDIDNDDETARFCKQVCERLGISKSEITPWNVFGGYGEKLNKTALYRNIPLCQSLLDTSAPVALIALGSYAKQMVDHLQCTCTIFSGPHPSRQGRANYVKENGGAYEEAEKCIEKAFSDAYTLVQNQDCQPEGDS